MIRFLFWFLRCKNTHISSFASQSGEKMIRAKFGSASYAASQALTPEDFRRRTATQFRTTKFPNFAKQLTNTISLQRTKAP
ncbi:MAG: hypothetical protein HUK16_07970 [Bacteroidales bacterium]|nr:hypothetical protein [Bacteroidales bacterium]